MGIKLRLTILAVLLWCVAALAHAQTPSSASGSVPLCQPANIDITYFFADTPEDHQVVAFNLKNLGSQDCRLKGEIGPSFAVDGHSMNVSTCWFCLPDGKYDSDGMKRNDQFVLSARDSAHVTYRWASKGDNCQRIDWFSSNFDWDGKGSSLFIPRLWKMQTCSPVNISGYEHGPASESANPPEVTLQVTNPSQPVYSDEWASLDLELKFLNSTVASTGLCHELYAIYQEGLGLTRFEPIVPGFTGDLPSQFKSPCEIPSDSSPTVVTLPASVSTPLHVRPLPNLANLRHIVWRTVTTDTHIPVFITADTRFTVVDPDTLSQNWGPQIQGVGVGLSIDKSTFAVGEPIPLHMRWENFAATEPLGRSECGEPWPQIELQDANHQLLQTLDTGAVFTCMGHGWGPTELPPGKSYRYFFYFQYGPQPRNGNNVQVLAPGTYYITTVWSPRVLAGEEIATSHSRGRKFGAVYATVRSKPVQIDIH